DSYLHNLVADPGSFELIDDRCNLAVQGFVMRATRLDLDLVDCLLLVYSQTLAEEIGRTLPYKIVTVDSRMCGIGYSLNANFQFKLLES
ncbi:MAG: hypothetical protein ACKVQS_13395, partial [Fimbriimonadaceae bacterium]